MKKVELTEQEWSAVLQAISNTPTQDLVTANQLISLIGKIQEQLKVKEDNAIQEQETKNVAKNK